MPDISNVSGSWQSAAVVGMSDKSSRYTASEGVSGRRGVDGEVRDVVSALSPHSRLVFR